MKSFEKKVDDLAAKVDMAVKLGCTEYKMNPPRKTGGGSRIMFRVAFYKDGEEIVDCRHHLSYQTENEKEIYLDTIESRNLEIKDTAFLKKYVNISNRAKDLHDNSGATEYLMSRSNEPAAEGQNFRDLNIRFYKDSKKIDSMTTSYVSERDFKRIKARLEKQGLTEKPAVAVVNMKKKLTEVKDANFYTYGEVSKTESGAGTVYLFDFYKDETKVGSAKPSIADDDVLKQCKDLIEKEGIKEIDIPFMYFKARNLALKAQQDGATNFELEWKEYKSKKGGAIDIYIHPTQNGERMPQHEIGTSVKTIEDLTQLIGAVSGVGLKNDTNLTQLGHRLKEKNKKILGISEIREAVAEDLEQFFSVEGRMGKSFNLIIKTASDKDNASIMLGMERNASTESIGVYHIDKRMTFEKAASAIKSLFHKYPHVDMRALNQRFMNDMRR